jgi:hypothetical protein
MMLLLKKVQFNYKRSKKKAMFLSSLAVQMDVAVQIIEVLLIREKLLMDKKLLFIRTEKITFMTIKGMAFMQLIPNIKKYPKNQQNRN